MMNAKQRRTVVEPFVREELGCACPDSAFTDIQIRPTPSGLPAGWLIGCGGRLLLMIPAAGAPATAPGQLELLFRRARALRDADGFNRFRLVLPWSAGGGETAAPPAVAADDRLHLHRVEPARLAALQAWLRDDGG
jgi:hypothetical protein